MKNTEFQDFASSRKGVCPMTVSRYSDTMNTMITPNIIEERASNIVPMDVFSRLMADRIIFLGVPIDDDVANIVQAQLLFLESQNSSADIQMYINSPGGLVHSGLAIYDTIQFIKSNVATTCTGMAASMASILLCAGTSGKRAALPHSRIMIHQPIGGVNGQASDILIAAKEIEKTRESLYRIISEHTGMEYDRVFIDSERDFWMDAEQAKEYGMIDSVL